MGYQGPGPAVVGEAEYKRLCKEWEDTAGGLIGSAITGPLGVKTLEPPVTHDPKKAREIPYEPENLHPPAPAVESLVSLHVMRALKLAAEASPEQAAIWLAEEEARSAGPRPTVVAALTARL